MSNVKFCVGDYVQSWYDKSLDNVRIWVVKDITYDNDCVPPQRYLLQDMFNGQIVKNITPGVIKKIELSNVLTHKFKCSTVYDTIIAHLIKENQ